MHSILSSANWWPLFFRPHNNECRTRECWAKFKTYSRVVSEWDAMARWWHDMHFFPLALWEGIPPTGGRSLRWRHNGRHGVSNHQPHDYLLNRLSRRRSKKSSKLCVTRLCERNSPVTDAVTRKMFPFDDVIMFPSQRESASELRLLKCYPE